MPFRDFSHDVSINQSYHDNTYMEVNYKFPMGFLYKLKEDNIKMPYKNIDWSNMEFRFESCLTGNKTLPQVKEVIYNNPATIIIWKDGTKTIVRNHNEEFDEEKGFAMAYLKKIFGGRSEYMKFIKNAKRQEKKLIIKDIEDCVNSTSTNGHEIGNSLKNISEKLENL